MKWVGVQGLGVYGIQELMNGKQLSVNKYVRLYTL